MEHLRGNVISWRIEKIKLHHITTTEVQNDKQFCSPEEKIIVLIVIQISPQILFFEPHAL